MNSKFYTLFLLITLFVTASCGQKNSDVKLEVGHNFVFGSSSQLQAISRGGLMLWGSSSSGDAFAQSMEDTDVINQKLSVGTWTFYAMAWDGSKNFNGTPMSPGMYYPFGGIQRCAKSAAVNVSGTAVVVNLSLNNSTCSDPVFKGSLTTTVDSGNIVLPKTSFSFCRNISQLTNGQEICADSLKDERQKDRKAWISSFKIKMKNFINIQGTKSMSGEISSKCIMMAGDQEIPTSATLSDSSYYGASSMKISGLPAGGPGMPFHMEIEMFPGNRYCDDVAAGALGIRGSLTKQFLNGINSEQTGSNKYFVYTNGGTNFHKQFLQITNESICNGRIATGLDGHPFAAGDGSKENPYLICSVPQFHAINSNSGSYLDKHFRLAADLNFNPYSKGLAGTGILPANFACLEDGSNFIPVGFSGATCTLGSPLVFGSPTAFTGSFMGSGYKISNLRLRAEDDDFIGMFAKIGTGTVPNEFGDFQIQNAEISGHQNVGTIAGELFPASVGDVNVWKIKANNLDIESRAESPSSNVGSLFGFFGFSSMENIQVLKSTVRGDSHYVGGLVGTLLNSTVNQASAEVDIFADRSSVIQGIGGIAGDVTGTSMNYVKHEGGIYSHGLFVGGLAGNVNSGSSIQNFYTMTFIYNSNSSSNLKMGGAVGKWDSSGSFGPGYSLSSIKSNCLTGCEQGAFVGEATNTTSAALYKLNPVETGYNGGALMNGETIVGLDIADMRVSANVADLIDSTTSDWKKVNSEYPRFDFENHPCTSGISGSGTGTSAIPKLICHEGQYLALTSAAANTYHELAGNIRLKNSGTTSNDLNFAAILDGKNHAVIAGHADALGGTNTGHFGTISSSAILKNIKYLGLSRYSNSGSLITDAHGVLVGTNSGQLDNIRLWAFGSYPRFGSLVAGKNTASGKMSYLEVSGSLKANYEGFASLAVENLGTIEDSKTQNEIICYEGAGCDQIAGLVVQNSGTIRRTEMSTHARENMSCPFTANISMLVDTNSGTIQDVLVSEHNDFRTTNGGNYFHRVNTGSLNRVFNAGRIESEDTSFGALPANFPTVASTITTGHTDVFRSGARSGKTLLREENFNCAANDVLTIGEWSSMPDYSSWNSAFMSTGYATDGKKLFADIEDQDGAKKLLRVHSYIGSNDFGVITGGCASGTSGKVTLYYTNDMAIDLAGNPATNVKPPQDSVYGNYPVAWQNVMWDYNNPDHHQQMLNFYAYLLGVSTTPATPRTWELEEDGALRLFNEK